jgi:nucleoside-diphosphate-sugar epimerase
MDHTLPGVLLTGASGFVGRNFIKAAAGRFRLFCIARRSMEEAGVQPEANLRWTQVDIADREKLQDLVQRVTDHGGVDYVVNLAGYYDFSNQDHPEYTRTNIQGTRNMLELARELGVQRFLFASSQAACPFGSVVTETTPPDADIPYARSKRAGEELLREYAQWFPCAIVRIAAVFSDWCEYPPLYTLLNTWLSGTVLESRIIAGRGQSALPYIHVHDLVRFFLRVIEKSASLERLCILNAGPDGTVSHLELFRIATQFYYQKTVKPIFVSRLLLAPMILARHLQCRLLNREPFEQLWMLQYVDQQLIADSSHTRVLLSWRPTPRKTITRRLVFLIENMRSNPDLWRNWNEAMLHKVSDRPHLILHDMLCDAMDADRDTVIEKIATRLLAVDQANGQAEYCRMLASMDRSVLHSYIRLLYQLLNTLIRIRNRPMMQQYAHTIAFVPMNTGFGNGCTSQCLFVISEYMIQRFRGRVQFQQQTPRADEYITMTIHMAADRIEDQVEMATLQSPGLVEEMRKSPPPTSNEQLEQVVTRLEELYNEAVSGKSWTSPLTKGQE